jgi:hypothetical protein
VFSSYLYSLVSPEWLGQPNRLLSVICLSLEEVSMYAGHKVLMKVDDNILLIVCSPCGILDQQLRLHPILLINIIGNCILFNFFN